MGIGHSICADNHTLGSVQGDGKIRGQTGARRREGGAGSAGGGVHRWGATQRAWERVPGDVGMNRERFGQLYSSDHDAVGAETKVAAHLVEQGRPMAHGAAQARELRADAAGGGRMATVDCKRALGVIWNGPAMRSAHQLITNAHGAWGAAKAPAPDVGPRRRSESKAIATEIGMRATCCGAPVSSPGRCPARTRPS